MTPFHVLLAAYTAFLGRVSGSEDVTVGTAVSGRHLPGVERVQGMFVNTLCLRTSPAAGLPFLAHLRAVAGHAMAAVDHQDHAFDALVARHERHDHGRHPLFDTFFALQDTGLGQVDFLGGRPRWRPDLTRRTIFDLDLQIEAEPDGYAARWAYATALFLRPTVELFRDELLALLDAALEAPGTPLGELRPVAAAPETCPRSRSTSTSDPAEEASCNPSRPWAGSRSRRHNGPARARSGGPSWRPCPSAPASPPTAGRSRTTLPGAARP
ncbi:condensation domain-containing protein [Nonomuraea antimicrobica]